jgi:predicted kinase
MDLWRRQLPGHANAVWNGYLSETGDHSGIGLLPLFLSCRAAVRAKTSATAARLQSEPGARSDLERAARDYLAMALQFLSPAPPCVVAIGGFSGSGKSTLARALAATTGAPPGAVVLRSDELRKRLCGVSPLERLGSEGYTPEMSQRVYGGLVAQSAAVVRAGFSVIADAVYAGPAERTAIEQVARDLGVTFVGLWLEAPQPVLADRLQRRVADASDADADVLHKQCGQGAGPVTWRRLDASAAPETVLEHAASAVATTTGVQC